MSAAVELDREIERAHAVAAEVLDPEIPVLTIADLGVLRRVYREGRGIVVELTPTYLGCPAVLAIELATEAALRDAGFADVRIVRVMTPAWTTDAITAAGRDKLRDYGIAPPARGSGKGRLLFETETIACPHCASTATERVSEFGSTACKAQWRCTSCREPFDYFKCI